MKKMTEIYTCDLCKCVTNSEVIPRINYPVLFQTDQTEGRGTTPYLSYEKIDICTECLKKVIRIAGSGAMGNNTYWIINKEEDR